MDTIAQPQFPLINSISVGKFYTFTLRWNSKKKNKLVLEALHKNFYDKYSVTIDAKKEKYFFGSRIAPKAFAFLSAALNNAKFFGEPEQLPYSDRKYGGRFPQADIRKSESENVIRVRIRHITEFDDESYFLLLNPENMSTVDQLKLRLKNVETEMNSVSHIKQRHLSFLEVEVEKLHSNLLDTKKQLQKEILNLFDQAYHRCQLFGYDNLITKYFVKFHPKSSIVLPRGGGPAYLETLSKAKIRLTEMVAVLRYVEASTFHQSLYSLMYNIEVSKKGGYFFVLIQTTEKKLIGIRGSKVVYPRSSSTKDPNLAFFLFRAEDSKKKKLETPLFIPGNASGVSPVIVSSYCRDVHFLDDQSERFLRYQVQHLIDFFRNRKNRVVGILDSKLRVQFSDSCKSLFNMEKISTFRKGENEYHLLFQEEFNFEETVDLVEIYHAECLSYS